MASDTHEGGGGHGHGGPLSNDLPPKPPPWRPQIHGYKDTYWEDRLDWTPMKREPLGRPDPETARIADALAARVAAEKARAAARRD